MFGYILLAITALFCLGLSLLTASKPTLVGDSAMGYGLGLAFLGLGFAVGSLALTITILSKGGFHWVAGNPGLRTGTVLAAWLCIAATTFFCAVFKWEWHSSDDHTYPQFLRWLALAQGQTWIPLLWLAACLVSLSPAWQSSVSPAAYKGSFFAGLIVGAVFSAGLVVGYFRDSGRQFQAQVAGRQEQEDRWQQQTLAFIDSQKPQDPIVFLLVHTTRHQADTVRQAALAKMKTHADYEGEILKVLQNPNYYREVYYFLDGNRVTDTRAFAAALNESIGWMARTITADIRDSNNLQHWSFDSYGIDRMLRAIDEQFQNQGVDFYPTVLRLRKALDTTPPERFKDVKFDITRVVDDWLARHRKR
ncbi:hypothetical protein [Larkinella soli]|uniref:hypothetical protein n=1 Tax=Larkinella soli TaxID=1770527 RepID=UPI000FFBA039|nr:hypothetical protein [Larkinella soli]